MIWSCHEVNLSKLLKAMDVIFSGHGYTLQQDWENERLNLWCEGTLYYITVAPDDNSTNRVTEKQSTAI